MFEHVIETYKVLEPPGADTWTPLASEGEMWHRARLLVCLATALRRTGCDVKAARFLDVGCGVGRSTRMLVEMGAAPENVTGVDLRADAIETARRLNPALRYRAADGPSYEASSIGRFDISLACTVFSSVTGDEARRELGASVLRHTRPGGYVFWWDRVRANAFAGHDLLRPSDYFPGCRAVVDETVPLRPSLAEAVRLPAGLVGLVGRLQSRLGHAPTHRSLLLRVGVEP